MSREVHKWLFLLLVFFVSGIFLRSFFDIPGLILFLALLFGFSLLGASLVFYLQEEKRFAGVSLLLAFVLIGTLLGVWRLDLAFSQEDHLQALRDTGESVKIEGAIHHEPDLRSDHVKYTIKEEETGGLILVSLDRFPRFNYGDRLALEGELLTPTEFPDFNYREFLEKDGIHSVMYYPEFELLEERHGFSLYAGVLQVKDVLRGGLQRSFPYPQSELLGAMVLGDKQLLPENLKESFNRTGIRHITAISGMHITIISVLLMTLFAEGFRFGKNKAFYLVLISLALYVALVGFPPSAVRAGIMAVIVLLAEKIGRSYFAPRALVLAAAGMLVFNPMLLRFDVGFQLSFLATLGILYLSPFFRVWLEKIFQKINLVRISIKRKTFSGTSGWLSKLLAMTLGAQIATLPILIYNFGLFSGSAPIVNVLVVPILPFIIALGFVGILSGIFSQTLGILVSFPAYLLLSYVIWISQGFERLFISGVEIENFHYSLIILFYIALVAVTLFLRRHLPQAELNLLPQFSSKIDGGVKK